MPALTPNKTQAPKAAPTGGFQQKEQKTYEAIPEGVYDAEIARIEYRSKELAAQQGKTWPAWKKDDEEIAVMFRITTGNHKKRTFWDQAPFDLSEGSKLRIWLQEIVGLNPLPDDFVFDTDELDYYEGLDCRIRLNTFWSKKDEANKNGIQEVLRATNATYTDADDMF